MTNDHTEEPMDERTRVRGDGQDFFDNMVLYDPQGRLTFAGPNVNLDAMDLIAMDDGEPDVIVTGELYQE